MFELVADGWMINLDNISVNWAKIFEPAKYYGGGPPIYHSTETLSRAFPNKICIGLNR